jgi:hypothetical protein
MNLTQLKQLYPQLANVDPRILASLTANKSPVASINYGPDDSGAATGLAQGAAGTPSSGLKSTGAFTVENPLAGFNALSSSGLKLLSGQNPLGIPGLKRGGQPKSSGGALPHIPEFKTGTTGHYVQGAGDGQSDDIPAMLADGEYVFDADTVAALGNGSNKAGALMLDKMRERIRHHKRSAPKDKIPPKAKSPLEYLKGL